MASPGPGRWSSAGRGWRVLDRDHLARPSVSVFMELGASMMRAQRLAVRDASVDGDAGGPHGGDDKTSPWSYFIRLAASRCEPGPAWSMTTGWQRRRRVQSVTRGSRRAGCRTRGTCKRCGATSNGEGRAQTAAVFHQACQQRWHGAGPAVGALLRVLRRYGCSAEVTFTCVRVVLGLECNDGGACSWW